MPYALTDTDKTEISSEVADSFVDAYYTALSDNRKTIPSFYVRTSESGRLLPHICYNGDVTNDAPSFQAKFEEMPFTHFDAQAVNAHVLNPAIDPADTSTTRKQAERNMSLIVQVSGAVRLYERTTGELRGFADSFVLVPNKEKDGKEKEGRKWVIQTQNFRFVT